MEARLETLRPLPGAQAGRPDASEGPGVPGLLADAVLGGVRASDSAAGRAAKRRCPKCEADLPLTAFGRTHFTSDGVILICRACCRMRTEALRGKTVALCHGCRASKPFDEFPAGSNICLTCSENPDLAARGFRPPYGRSSTSRDVKFNPLTWARYIHHATRHSAANRGLPHEVTVEYIASLYPADGRCPICARIMIPKTRSAPSVDRGDNLFGYVEGNINIICKTCNSRKGDASPEELQRLANYALRSRAAGRERAAFDEDRLDGIPTEESRP